MVSRWCKPGVPRLIHLFVAPLLWTLVGCSLMVRGWGWLEPGRGRLLILAAGLLGTIKSVLILDKVARRAIQRLVLFEDGTCLGAVYSWQTWLLVLAMMAAGLVLRVLSPPGPALGTLYGAIGWALCFSSRLGWATWYHMFNTHELT